MHPLSLTADPLDGDIKTSRDAFTFGVVRHSRLSYRSAGYIHPASTLLLASAEGTFSNALSTSTDMGNSF